ncbi:ETX/MTX2 family pore-forming toxin, partial [Enterococcus faecium]|nr:ETX/MTX2 family pore-forming toxin [Enterococcus faecium]
VLLSIIITTGMISQILMSPTGIFADTNKLNTSVSSGEASHLNISDRLTNELRDLSSNLSSNFYLNNDIPSTELITPQDKTNQTPVNLKDTTFVKLNDDMVLSKGDTLAAHESVLENNSAIDQVMNTASFNYVQIDRVTTSTTNSTGVGLTTSANMKFPFASGSVSMNVKYDFSNTNSVETSTTKQWQVPSQNIKIPAGHKYKVNWVLNTGVATGTADLTSSVTASIPFKIYGGNRYVGGIGWAISNQDRLVAAMPNTQYKWAERDHWEAVEPYRALRKWESAQYKAEFGTELVMKITDVTNGNSPVTVQQTPMNVAPITVK